MAKHQVWRKEINENGEEVMVLVEEVEVPDAPPPVENSVENSLEQRIADLEMALAALLGGGA